MSNKSGVKYLTMPAVNLLQDRSVREGMCPACKRAGYLYDMNRVAYTLCRECEVRWYTCRGVNYE